MHTRGARLSLVALLVAVGGAAVFLLWEIHRQEREITYTERAVAQQVHLVTTSLADISLAQHGYLSLADPSDAQVRIGAGVTRIRQAIERLGALARAPQTAALLDTLEREIQQLAEVDARAREYAESGQTFLASDLLSRVSRARLSAASTYAGQVREAEAEAADTAQAVLRDEMLSALAASGAVWLTGLLLLAWTGGAPRRDTAAVPSAAVTSPAPPSAESAAAASGRATVDLAAAAALCSDFSRVTSASALPSLLARAAGLLEARGLIVWMAAGDQLFAAASHGYDARMMGRLAPIDRATVNATATAWRTGRLGTVRAEGDAPGAIVAPMFGAAHCIGVLAAEVRHGREQDPATRALTAILAAQLASIVAAWPSASTGSAEESGRDRATG